LLEGTTAMTTYYLTQQVFDRISESLNLRKIKLTNDFLEIQTLITSEPAPPWNANLSPDDQSRDHWRKKTKEQFSDPEKRKRHLQACLEKANHKDKIWINNGVNNKRIRLEKMVDFPEWKRGRLIPKNKIDLMISNRITTRNPLTGKFMKKGATT
jgi:hypothetical protein